jgi:hypothetical protein
MNLQQVKFHYRGKVFEGTIAMPSDINEAITAMGAEEVFDCFKMGYAETQKKRIRTKRVKKNIKLNIESLTDDQKAALSAVGIRLK